VLIGQRLKMVKFQTFMGLWPWPRFGSYCIPSCITHIYLHTEFHCNQRNFLWTDGGLLLTANFEVMWHKN